MAYCGHCGAEAVPGGLFCPRCGQRLENEIAEPPSVSQPYPGYDQITALELPYEIPLQRILFMTIASYGLYLFYWYYVTWKHYRESTGEKAYPIWHALTLLVPIYNLFRTHAHMRVFRDLMRGRGLVTTISTGWAVAAVWVSGAIGWFSFRLSFGEEMTQRTAVAAAVLDGISMVIVAWLLLHVQSNLNSYWHHLSEGRAIKAKVGVGEVVFVVLGLLGWVDTLATLFSEGYRLGP